MKVYNVMIFPAGTEIAMEIYQALRYVKNVRLFGGRVCQVMRKCSMRIMPRGFRLLMMQIFLS